MNEELIKKLAEWAEFKSIIITEYNIEAFTPDGWAIMLHFPQSLDACFKWLVPKLWIIEMTTQEGIFFSWLVGHPKYGKPVAGEMNENPALALCLAIEKLIDLGVVLNEKAH